MDEERATAALDEAGIDYTLVRHGPVSSLAEAAQLRGVHPGQVVKTLVVRRARTTTCSYLSPATGRSAGPSCAPSSTSPACRCPTPRQPVR